MNHIFFLKIVFRSICITLPFQSTFSLLDSSASVIHNPSPSNAGEIPHQIENLWALLIVVMLICLRGQIFSHGSSQQRYCTQRAWCSGWWGSWALPYAPFHYASEWSDSGSGGGHGKAAWSAQWHLSSPPHPRHDKSLLLLWLSEIRKGHIVPASLSKYFSQRKRKGGWCSILMFTFFFSYGCRGIPTLKADLSSPSLSISLARRPDWSICTTMVMHLSLAETNSVCRRGRSHVLGAYQCGVGAY